MNEKFTVKANNTSTRYRLVDKHIDLAEIFCSFQQEIPSATAHITTNGRKSNLAYARKYFWCHQFNDSQSRKKHQQDQFAFALLLVMTIIQRTIEISAQVIPGALEFIKIATRNATNSSATQLLFVENLDLTSVFDG